MIKNIIYLINVNNGSYATHTYPLIEEYAKKVNADIAVFDTEIFESTSLPHPNFLIFEILKHFKTTDYARMMYIDMDIRILPHSPNIFEEFKGFAMVEDHKADLWRRDAMNDFLKYYFPGLECKHYFNGGVMIADHDSVEKLLNVIPDDYVAFWRQHPDGKLKSINQTLLNLFILQSNIEYTVMPDMYNKVCRKATANDYFIHYVANKNQIQTEFDKFKDNICNESITMTLENL
jgi:hypothetical protein